MNIDTHPLPSKSHMIESCRQKIPLYYPFIIKSRRLRKICRFSFETLRKLLEDKEECIDSVAELCDYGNLKNHDCRQKGTFGIGALNGIQIACQDSYFEAPDTESGDYKTLPYHDARRN